MSRWTMRRSDDVPSNSVPSNFLLRWKLQRSGASRSEILTRLRAPAIAGAVRGRQRSFRAVLRYRSKSPRRKGVRRRRHRRRRRGGLLGPRRSGSRNRSRGRTRLVGRRPPTPSKGRPIAGDAAALLITGEAAALLVIGEAAALHLLVVRGRVLWERPQHSLLQERPWHFSL